MKCFPEVVDFKFLFLMPPSKNLGYLRQHMRKKSVLTLFMLLEYEQSLSGYEVLRPSNVYRAFLTKFIFSSKRT